MTPVASCLQVAQIQLVLQPHPNASQSPGDLSCHEGLAAARRFMIEQNSIRNKEIVSLTGIYSIPIGGHLTHSIRTPRIERRLFVLRRRRSAKHLRRTRLIESRPPPRGQRIIAERFQEP